MSVDFGRTADDYAENRAGFPPSLVRRLQQYLAAAGQDLTGARALDLGTGTGTLARGLAQAGLQVEGLDPSENMLAQAKKLDARAGVEIDYHLAAAEDSGLAAGQFDLVTAGQCWHWFDRPQAAAEVLRLLKPGGHLAICHYDWLPLPGNLVAATEALIRAHNPTWQMHGGNGIYGKWVNDLRVHGFHDVASFSYDEPAVYSPQAWRGRIRASAGVAASLSPAAVAAFDREHSALLAERFRQDPLIVDHGVFAALGRKPA